MEDFICHASNPSASLNDLVFPPSSSSLLHNNVLSPHKILTRSSPLNTHPTDSEFYFQALLDNTPHMASTNGIIALLVLPSSQIASLYKNNDSKVKIGISISVDEAKMYLKGVAKHKKRLLDCWCCVYCKSDYEENEQKDEKFCVHSEAVLKILKAVGAAAYLCRKKRSYISSSGILPALEKIAIGYHNFYHSISECVEYSNDNEASVNVPPISLTTLDSTSIPISSNINCIQTPGSSSLPSKRESTQDLKLIDATSSKVTSNSSNNINNCIANKGGHALNPAHVEFLHCCLLASHHHYASLFVNKHPITEIPHLPWGRPCGFKYNSNITTSRKSICDTSIKTFFSNELAEGYLKYYYYLGLVRLGCEEYDNAICAFRLCLTLPSKKVSKITIMAWKKYILTQMIVLGEREEHDNIITSRNLDEDSGEIVNHTRANEISNRVMKILALPLSTSCVVSRYLSTDKYVSSPGRLEEEYIGKEKDKSKKNMCMSGKMMSIIHFRSFDKNLILPNDVSNYISHKESNHDIPNLEENDIYPYHDLTFAMISSKYDKVEELMKRYENLWKKDGTMGLVKKLLTYTALHRNIRRIATVYSVVSMKKMSKKLSLDLSFQEQQELEVENILMDIALREDRYNNYIVSDDNVLFSDLADNTNFFIIYPIKPFPYLDTTPIPFQIDSQNNLVYFDKKNYINDVEKTSSISKRSIQTEMLRRVRNIQNLAEKISRLDINLTTSSRYQLALKMEKSFSSTCTTHGIATDKLSSTTRVVGMKK